MICCMGLRLAYRDSFTPWTFFVEDRSSAASEETLFTSISLMAFAAVWGAQDAVATVEKEPTPWWRDDNGWRVFSYPDQSMCDIGYATPAGGYITVGYRPKERATNLGVLNPHVTSLRVGESRRLVVVFGPAIGKSYVRSHTLTFEVVEADGQLVLSASDTYADFLADLGSSGVMGVLTPSGAVVAAIELRGSKDAVQHLRACAFQAAKLDPADPFLREQ